VEALRDSVVPPTRPSVLRAVSGVVIAGLGAAGLLTALYGDAPFLVFGLGLLGSIVGVIILMPFITRPLAAIIARPVQMRGMPGELAKQNAMRNPRRTASTAAALMIGLTLVVSMGVFASSLKASFSQVVGEATNADLFVTASSLQSAGYSPEVNKVVATVPGVEAVSANGWGQARFDSGGSSYSSIDPATASQAMDLGIIAGSIPDLAEKDSVIVFKDTAESKGWGIGDTVVSEFAETGKHTMHIVGIYDNKGWIADNYIVSLETQNTYAGKQLSTAGLVLLADGADTGEVQGAVDAALADHPDAQVLNQKEYEQEASGFIDQLLTFVTVMLLFAVVIALLGIVNTLVLSVFERTRELGLLRAVGMTRNQVRAMVRWESVVISLIGAITGAALGTGIGLALAQALRDLGIKSIDVPVIQIIIYVLLAAVAGILAAIGPARSASKVDVLKAVVTE
jgi:putative ABC transport system permease protein